MKHIKVLGITGGVGAGKSTVLDYLEKRYGAYVIQLDKVSHELIEPQGACFEKILELYGRDILVDGRIDHKLLYNKAFADGRDPEKLNAILHPAVKEEVRRRIAEYEKEINEDAGTANENAPDRKSAGETSKPLVVLEAALLLEDHYEKICDEIWYIYVREDVRERRLIASRGYTVQKIHEILSNQRSEEEFRRDCQFVVDNSSDILENTYEQIDRGLKEHEFV